MFEFRNNRQGQDHVYKLKVGKSKFQTENDLQNLPQYFVLTALLSPGNLKLKIWKWKNIERLLNLLMILNLQMFIGKYDFLVWKNMERLLPKSFDDIEPPNIYR